MAMTRAERRRAAREEKKAKTATYNFTEAQLQDTITELIGKQLEEAKKEATDDAVNVAMILMLTLPLEVLKDHYWTKGYATKLPGFVDHVLEYYRKWQDGEIDIEDLKKDLWEIGGVRLEETED